METALHDVTRTFLKIQEEIPEYKKEVDKDDLVSTLYLDPRFEAVKEYIDAMIEHLDNLEGAISPTDTPETVGFRYLVSRITKNYLSSVRDLPEVLANAKRAGNDE